MGRRSKFSLAIQEMVRQRANYLCEYCHTSEQWQYVPFTIDHVIPLAKGGSDAPDNLALACFHCNRQKAKRTNVIDPDSGLLIALFNPRQHAWREHFIWSADSLWLIGLTSLGRATIVALDLNRERVIHLRAADAAIGRHPPVGDPILRSDVAGAVRS